jgi:hypothetical protein
VAGLRFILAGGSRLPAPPLDRLPRFEGRPIRLSWGRGLRVRQGRLESGPGPGQEVHAGGFPLRRRLVLDEALRKDPAELERILLHELFHFVWPRLGNPVRWEWESLLRRELGGRARGEAGWSSEWRKAALRDDEIRRRTRKWREYACESFCDTAAWFFSSRPRHPEVTLAVRHRMARKAWFRSLLERHASGFPT